MKTFLLILVLSLNVANPLLGADYRIQAHRPAKPGQQFTLTCQAEQTHKETLSSGPAVLQTKRTNRKIEAEAQVRVLEIGAEGRITKVFLTFANCSRTDGKDKSEVLPAGTAVTASVENNQERFLVNGKPVDAETQFALSLVASLRNEETLDYEALGTDKPRQIGESWDVNAEPIVSTFQKFNLGLSPESLQGRTTLERLVKVGEVECLEIAAKIYIKKLAPPLPEGLQMKRFFGSIRFSGKLPVDPALGLLEEMLDLSVEFTAEGVPPALGRAVTLNSISTVKRTAQMSYLK